MISLIVAYYKNFQALELIIEALKIQTFRDFELIVAEDNDSPETISFIKKMQEKVSFPIVHTSHEDLGFRKTKILNEAVKTAKGEKLVFIDGDCIPHRKFLEEYNTHMKEGHYYYGRRVMLGVETTKQLLESKDLRKLSFIKLLFSDSTNVNNGFYNPFSFGSDKTSDREIWGCNWAIYKKHIIEVNGFDEDYTKPCFGEDIDIGWRLKENGEKLISLKSKVIVYHLHHKENYDEAGVQTAKLMYDEKFLKHEVKCKNGMLKLT